MATDFHDNKIPKEGSDYTCLAFINVRSILKNYKNYYPRNYLIIYTKEIFFTTEDKILMCG